MTGDRARERAAARAASRLGNMLLLDVVGDLLETIGDPTVRELLIKVTTKLRGIVDDEREAARKE